MIVIIYTGAHNAILENPRTSICRAHARVSALQFPRTDSTNCLGGVGASGLDVTSLLALVADLLATSVLLGAVTAEVTVLTAVVALGSVGTVARHVAITTAAVALLLLAAVAAAATLVVGRLVAATTIAAAAAIHAVPGNVAQLAALVALNARATATASGATGGTSLGAVTRDVAGLVAAVAGLVVLGALGAITAHMALISAVVALGRSPVGALTGLVSSGTTGVASTSGEIHF
jgi:hypothetical protein